MSTRLLPVLAWLALASACVPSGSRPTDKPLQDNNASDDDDNDPPPAPTSATDAIRLGLAPACAGCHGQGTNRPFFASLHSFESLLAHEPTLVVPGDADASRLIALLEGVATGTFTQMPPEGLAFAAMPDTAISVGEVRAWIEDLVLPVDVDARPDPQARHVRRMNAEQIIENLYVQLGLTEEEFFGSYYQAAEYAVLANDRIEPRPYIRNDAYQRFDALGGPSWMQARKRSQEISPTFVQSLTQMSQAWCLRSIAKPDTPLLVGVALTDTTSTNDAAIRTNIRRLYTSMLSDEPEASDEETLHTVFAATEASGTDVAWAAVCAALIKSPLWVLY